jgi:hypothetical protein
VSSSSYPADVVEALRSERDAARSALVAMEGELRRLQVERDLLRAQLQAATHKLFAAKSEARGSEQRDLFLNEVRISLIADRHFTAKPDAVSLDAGQLFRVIPDSAGARGRRRG